MIPVMVVPVLTKPEILYRMLESVDYEVGVLVVIDNGACVSRHELAGMNRTHIGRRHLWKMPSNLGVATSWNLGIKATPFAPWWLVVNFDVVWPSGSLEKFVGDAGPDRLVLSGGAQPWCVFAIGEQVIDRVGLFDEGIHPAYWEDVDYTRRAVSRDTVIINSGAGPTHVNSSTLSSGYDSQNDRTFPENATRAQERASSGDMSNGEWSLRARRALSWD